MKIHLTYFLVAFVILSVALSCNEKEGIQAPEILSVSEGFENPIGFYDATPTFSWKLPISSSTNSQTAYQIVAASDPKLLPENPDLWNSEKQLSNQSTWINYVGKPLTSRQKVYWQVKYWNDQEKESNWSEVNHFELGLLTNLDWQAKWTGLATASDSIKGKMDVLTHRPQYLRKRFELSSDVVSARLYVTAKGVFDAWINGKNISDDVMPPGWTPYNKRIETLTYDVTSFLTTGQNTLSFELAPGWHSGRLGWNKTIWANSQSPKILCQLEMTMADGSKEIVLSDETWVGTTKGPIRFSEIYDGEVYDANLEMPNWTNSTFDDKKWDAVEVASIEPNVKLEPKRHSTVKQKLSLQSQEIIKNTDTSLIFDIQQNMVGVPLLKVPVKKGDTLIIRFAEMLSPDGSFFTENYRSAHSTDYYIASETKTIEWSPKFTFHGFRYVELSGYDTSKEPTKDWVTGLVLYSNFKEQGNFTTSHEKLNQLQSNIIWGLRGNFFDIPTDCPQRDERLGWTGDAQVFAPTSIYNADVHAFWASWLQSLRESQFDNGGIPFVIPDVLKNEKVSSGWGDAAVVIPWEIYYRTGDVRILEENFDMMKKWINFHESETTNYISHMNSFSDWLQPFADKNDRKGDTPMNYISTAYFAHVTKLAQQTAQVLGKKKDEEEFKTLFSSIQTAFENEFFDETGKIKNNKGTQTAYLMAIGFGLLSNEMEQMAIPHLLEKIKEADYHLRTGFLGTPLLSKVLDHIGRSDVMFTLLLNETYPSWFYSINQGATTIWERWNSYSKTEGFSKEKMNSLNHYAYGAIGQWMYERIAGIAPLEPGYKKIRIAPLVGGGLTSASGSYNSPYGIIKSSWELENEIFKLEISVPSNTKAEVKIPCKKENEVQLNGVSITNNKDIKLIEKTDDIVTIEVGSGDYSFTVKMP